MRQAFSLVEIAVVMVLVGLLVGGVMAGQSLVRSAELRAITTEHTRWITAITAFIDKYDALPGDFPKATRYWSQQAAAGCNNLTGSSAGQPGACDGDGSGLLDNAPAASSSGENYQFWRQLALAGLLNSEYTGIAGSNNYAHHVVGTNTPASRVSSGGWAVQYIGPYTDANLFQLDYGHAFLFGGRVDNWIPNASILQPREVWQIDTKIDDGQPARGKVVAYNRSACTNATSDVDYATTYALEKTEPACAIQFIQQF